MNSILHSAVYNSRFKKAINSRGTVGEKNSFDDTRHIYDPFCKKYRFVKWKRNKFQGCAFWLLSDKQYKDAENLVPGRLTETPSGTPKLYGP